MKIIGLDIGEKRIGVARADTNTKIAVPLGFIEVNGSELNELARLSRLNNTTIFILGLPRSNEGNETAQSTYVRNFAKSLKNALPEAKIYFEDESLTSVIAEERLKKRGKNFQKGDIDAEAATIILQAFIERYMNKLKSLEKTALESALEDNSKEKNLKKTLKNSKNENGKKKSSKGVKIISILLTILILGLGAAGAAFLIKDKILEQRAAERERFLAENALKTFNFTILPGETVNDIKNKLLELGYDSASVNSALNPKNYSYAFLSGLDSLEGYLYGETIQFYEDTPPTEIIDRFLSEMESIITKNGLENAYAEQGLSLHEGITLASIIQKEAPPSEHSTLAQIFLYRLNTGIKLGSDVTVAYALDKVDPNREIYTDHTSALSVDSCYNTRLYFGLPCGPISNPSLSALLAVAEPADTDYLYFLTGDDGMMYYSYTDSEHAEKIFLYCKELCNASL